MSPTIKGLSPAACLWREITVFLATSGLVIHANRSGCQWWIDLFGERVATEGRSIAISCFPVLDYREDYGKGR